MKLYIDIANLHIPSYGLMIVLGVISANIFALSILKKHQLDFNDFIITEGYIFLGAILGEKLLYIVTVFQYIDWSRITDMNYFNQLMQGGFVFYGGLIGGLLAMLLAGKLHHIQISCYCKHFIFLIPWIHGFGRIGCYLAGCCYGKPYEGKMAVIYPAGSYAPSGIPLFPVQLVEACALIFIAILIYFLDFIWKCPYTAAVYFLSYSVLRFILEYYRYDEARGRLGMFSTSQWISILLFGGTIVYLSWHSLPLLQRWHKPRSKNAAENTGQKG